MFYSFNTLNQNICTCANSVETKLDDSSDQDLHFLPISACCLNDTPFKTMDMP